MANKNNSRGRFYCKFCGSTRINHTGKGGTEYDTAKGDDGLTVAFQWRTVPSNQYRCDECGCSDHWINRGRLTKKVTEKELYPIGYLFDKLSWCLGEVLFDSPLTLDGKKFNHRGDWFGRWVEYNGWRYKDIYDIELYNGIIALRMYPNANAWSGALRVEDESVKRIRLSRYNRFASNEEELDTEDGLKWRADHNFDLFKSDTLIEVYKELEDVEPEEEEEIRFYNYEDQYPNLRTWDFRNPLKLYNKLSLTDWSEIVDEDVEYIQVGDLFLPIKDGYIPGLHPRMVLNHCRTINYINERAERERRQQEEEAKREQDTGCESDGSEHFPGRRHNDIHPLS